MSRDLAPIEKCLVACQDEIKKTKQFYKLSLYALRNKAVMEIFGSRLGYYTSTWYE